MILSTIADKLKRRCPRMTCRVEVPVTRHLFLRSRRAALSGGSAIAGFCPHRSHRAALPQWALQDGPEAD